MTHRQRASSAPPRFRVGFAATRGIDVKVSRLLSALSAILMGYDFGVTAGILVMESFVYDYCVDWHNYLREDCSAPIADLPGPWTTLMTRYIVVHHVSCFVGRVISGRLTDRYGRRGIISSAAMLYCIACGAAFTMPQHWRRLLLTARAAQGLTLGVFSSAMTLLASEIAPFDRRRADLSRVSRIAFAAGVVLANGANLVLERRIMGWRKTNAGATPIPLIVMVAIFFVPPSPKWTYLRKGREEAEKILHQLRSSSDVQLELDNFALDSKNADRQRLPLSKTLGDCKPVLVTLSALFLQQATGVGALLTFGALIFKDVARAGLPASMLLSLAYLLGSVSADQLLRTFGRRRLLLLGAISMAVSHSTTAALYWMICNGNDDTSDDVRCSDSVGWLLSWSAAWFVFSFAASWGLAASTVGVSSGQTPINSASHMDVAPTTIAWITTAAAVEAGMALLTQAQLNDVFFVLAWLCGYAGLFVYVFCQEASGNSYEDCKSVRDGREELSACLEIKSRSLLKTV